MKLFNIYKFRFIDWYMKTSVIDVYQKCKIEQWYSQNDLLEMQFIKLKEMLIHAYDKTDYYNSLFNQVGFNPRKMSDFSDIKLIPIQTKKSIKSNFKSIKSHDFFDYNPRLTRTSGSTGEPFEIFRSGLSHTYLRSLNFVAWNQAGYELGDKYASFSGGSLFPDQIKFKEKIYAYLLNATIMPSYHLSKERFNKYLLKLQKEKIKYIYGYSSALYDFAQSIKKENLNFSFIKGIFSSSDMLFKNQRKFIESVFGVKLIDIYGNPESGLLSFECYEQNGFHYGMQNCFVEIVDESGKNLGDNEIGRIIVTDLNNKCFPMIRYDTGDIGSISYEKCSCGRGLILIKNLGGRSRDYIILPDGRHIHGAFFNHLDSIYKADWLDRYHIKQKSKDLIIFQCIVNRDVSSEELNKIKKEIEIGTNNLIKVEMEIVDSIPITKMGKYKLITREIEE